MLIIDCFGHNIYIEDKLVGYINENELIISGKKFADITDDGVISFGPKELGYIDDDEEYEKVADAFDEFLDNSEFDELV
jgi:hypothetical protein